MKKIMAIAELFGLHASAKIIADQVLSLKGIVHVVHVPFVEPKVMKELYGVNIIIHLKFQSFRNTFEAMLTTVLTTSLKEGWIKFAFLAD